MLFDHRISGTSPEADAGNRGHAADHGGTALPAERVAAPRRTSERADRPLSPTGAAPTRAEARVLPSPPAVDHQTACRLGERLRDVGYSDEELAQLRAPDVSDPESERAVLARRVEPGSPLATVIRLFHLNVNVEASEVQRALAPLSLQALLDGGLLETRATSVRSRVHLVPLGSLLLASDAGDPMSKGPEFVAGATISTVALLGHTLRRPGDRALDVGCGSGALSIAAATHSNSVLATDANPRACQFTRLNAALNGLDNVTCRVGNWFDPVRNELFDLVVCNPPFVISPDRDFLFRDAGLSGDEIARRMITLGARHLRTEGFAQVMCNWLHQGEDWASPVREWADGLGCDVWTLRFASMDPVSYAVSWNSHLKEVDPAGFESAVDRWVAYYRELNVDHIASGLVVARRRPEETNWFRAATLSGTPAGDPTDHLLRLFALPSQISDEALLDSRPRAPEGQRLEISQVAHADGYRTERATVACLPGLGLTGRIEPVALPLVAGCDGRHTVAELIEQAGVAPGAALAAIRRLTELGLVSLS